MFNQNVQEKNVPFQWWSLNFSTPRTLYFVLHIVVFMCSRRRLPCQKFNVTYNFFTTSIMHKVNGSKTFITLPHLLFLVIMLSSFAVLLHNNVRLLQITENSQLSSGPPAKLGRSVHLLSALLTNELCINTYMHHRCLSLPRAWIYTS